MVKYYEGDGLGSHRRLLQWAIDHSDGPILELGTGYYSTPITHQAAKSGRLVKSYEHDADWLARMAQEHQHANHSFSCPPAVQGDPTWPDWNMVPYQSTHWGVVLIDNRPSYARVLALVAVAQHADFVVVHDTEQPLYYYANMLDAYKHRYEDVQYPKAPNTTIVSNFKEINFA